MKQMGSAKKTSKSKKSSTRRQPRLPSIKSSDLRYVVCINNGGYVDLDQYKLYRVRRDTKALAAGLIRIIDESGEDYLFPVGFFKPAYAPRSLFAPF